jgi:hypothetical protein
MLKNLRLAIVDYPKILIKNNTAHQMISDMLKEKQLNYERTDINYVPFSSLDMISTHFYIYDTTDIYSPLQIVAMRMTSEKRCIKHKLDLPYKSYAHKLTGETQKNFNEFRKYQNIVDAGSMCVHPNWTAKNIGISLIDIGYFMLFTHIIKTGQHNMMATTNERFKASRTLYPVGEFNKLNHFNHPMVDDPHLLVLFENINSDWLKKSMENYHYLYENRVELVSQDPLESDISLSDEGLYELIKSLPQGSNISLGKIRMKSRESIAS